MIRPATKLRFVKTTDHAREAGKKDFDYHCIIYGVNRAALGGGGAMGLAGAHVFPASTFPELSRCVENILPITGFRHSWRGKLPDGTNSDCLDIVMTETGGRDRKPLERFTWLRENVHRDYRASVHDRLALLITEGSKLSREVSAGYLDFIEILAGWDA